jgi:carbonic anhydrase
MARASFSSGLHITLGLAVALWLDAADAAQMRKNKAENGQPKLYAFDYARHGMDWGDGACSSRARQSPIDLPVTAAVIDPFHYHYFPITQPFEVYNTGKVYMADLADQGYGGITYENAYYELQSVEVHSLSEHTWASRQRPVEIQMIHKRYDGEAKLIVSVGLDQPVMAMPQAYGYPFFVQLNATSSGNLRAGSKHQQPATAPVPTNTAYVPPVPYEANFNPTVQAFLTQALPPIDMKLRVPADSAHSYDLNTFLADGTFFDYGGSLTEPPCSETVTWLVRNEIIPASLTQMMYLQQGIYQFTTGKGNYRTLMPLNGRTISQRAAVLGDPPLAAPPSVPLSQQPPTSDRLRQAAVMSMDAMRYAKAATYFMKDLDARMHLAAEAHAASLAPRLEPLRINGKVVIPVDGNMTGADIAMQSEMHANETHVDQYHQAKLSPEQMQNEAIKMARILSDATRQVVEEATDEIAKEAKKASKDAARKAAEQVLVAR